MAIKKYKKLTNREKQFRKEIKQELVEKGIVSPPKPPLNRKKFIEETRKIYNESDKDFDIYIFILSAISYMMGHYDSKFKLSLEAVGAAKVLRVALKLKEFHDQLKREGKTKYNVIDEYKCIEDILKM